MFTVYYVEISVIRESGTDAPKHVYISTTLVDKSSYDHSEIYIYSGDVFVTFVEPTGWALNGTVAIGVSPLAGARIESPSGDLVVELTHSKVTMTSATEMSIVLSHDEYESLLLQIDDADFVYTSLSLVYAGGNTIMPMSEFCLLLPILCTYA